MVNLYQCVVIAHLTTRRPKVTANGLGIESLDGRLIRGRERLVEACPQSLAYGNGLLVGHTDEDEAAVVNEANCVAVVLSSVL